MLFSRSALHLSLVNNLASHIRHGETGVIHEIRDQN
jgi:hypothetical protein